MKRKVIQIAASTQLISLPRKWCIKYGIKKGDELDVEEEGDQLSIAINREVAGGQVSVDITDLDRTSIIHLIRALYKRGYDEVQLTFQHPTCKYARLQKELPIISVIHYEVNRLTGMEIFQQKEGLCVLRTVAMSTDKELDNMIRRIFLLLNDAVTDIIQGAHVNDQLLLQAMQEKHDTLTKFISYCIRIINKGTHEAKTNYFLYHIVASIERIVDLLLQCSRDLHGYHRKIHKQSSAVLETARVSFLKYYDLYYNFTLVGMRELSENRERVNQQLLSAVREIPAEEISFLCTFRQSLDVLRDITEARLAMSY